MPPAFRCTGLTKAYGAFQLGPLDLELEPGVVLGYLGPNGSGKTTTMNCLTGLVRPDGGEAEIAGRQVDLADPEWRRHVALVTDRQPFYERWSAARNLQFLAGFYPGWREATAADLARRFDLALDHRVRDLSRGNRVKLALVAALAASPRLLLLDEPTAGLDPVVRDDVLGILFDMLEQGDRSLFYSTHILSDIGRLADELAFLVDGQVALRASVADLVEQWRAITFRMPDRSPLESATIPGQTEQSAPPLSGDGPSGVELNGALRLECEGPDYRAICFDGTAALSHLGELGAEHLRPAAMSIDAIAVEIMRGGYRVAVA